MSFINKVKNFFYEDIEEDDEEFEAREAAKREEKLQKKLEKEKKKELLERIREDKKEEVKEPAKDLSERELFKSEKTFNFPMDIGDDIFDLTQTMPSIKEPEPKEESRYESRSALKEDKNLYARPTTRITPQVSSSVYKEPEVHVDDSPKRFKPSPVVSPVYGILDKNYTVEDVVEKNLDKTKEFSIEKKIVDFDTVRNKAYKELDEEIEKTLTGSKDIFYNLDEEESIKDAPEEVTDFVEEAYDKDENKEETYDMDDVIITYEGEASTPVEEEKKEKIEETVEEKEIPEEEEEEDFQVPDVEIPKATKRGRKKVVKEVAAEEKKEEKEDLFNLIDNMYNDEEDEEEDD